MTPRLTFLLLLSAARVAAAEPRIFYTDIVAGPNSGGEDDLGSYLSLFGQGFGSDLAELRVTVGGGEVARYLYLGPSFGRPDVQQLSVQLGPGAASGSIALSLGGVTYGSEHQFTVRPGNFYFVSPLGDNATGVVNDVAHPYRTANHVMALPEFDAGDFMILRGGTYDLSAGSEELYNYRWLNLGVGSGGSLRSGTAETNTISIQGYPGESPVIDWGSLSDGGTYGIRAYGSTEFYSIANLVFDLRDSGGAAMFMGFYTDPGAHCNDCRMVNLRVKGGMAGGQSGVSPFYLHRAERSELYGLDIGAQSSLADPQLGSHVIYVSHFYTDVDIGWIYMHDNPYGRGALQLAGDGWGVTPYSVENGTWGQNTNVRIHDSRFENLPREAIITNLGSFEVYIYNNVIINADTRNDGTWSPIALRGAEQNQGRYYLFNNTIYSDAFSSGTDGYSTNSVGGLLHLGFMTGTVSGTYPEHVTLSNNIFRSVNASSNYWCLTRAGGAAGFDPRTQTTSDYNLWFGSNQAVPDWEGPNRVEADPLFVDAAGGDLRLQSGSPARDAGADLGMAVPWDHDHASRPNGAGFDIGAYELVPTCVIDADCVAPPSCRLAVGATCMDGSCLYPAAPSGSSCDDGDPCSSGDQCDGTGTCQAVDSSCQAGPILLHPTGCECRSSGGATALLATALALALARRRR